VLSDVSNIPEESIVLLRKPESTNMGRTDNRMFIYIEL
jgi:hypothetical protein